MAGVQFFSHGSICLNKDLQLRVLALFLKIKNILSNVHTYIKKRGWLFHCNSGIKTVTLKMLLFYQSKFNIGYHTRMTSTNTKPEVTNQKSTNQSPSIRKNEQQICCLKTMKSVTTRQISRPPHLLSVWTS